MAIRPDHSFNAFSDDSHRGRPRKFDLSEAEKKALAQIYLATNATRKSGSMTIAWDLFTAAHPEIEWDRNARSSKHTLPAVAIEVMKAARPLVGFHRGARRSLGNQHSVPASYAAILTVHP